MLGDGLTAVANDRQSQAEREAIWRAANEGLPPEKRIGEETMRYLRGGIFNTQTWKDGGTGALPDLSPELLQRAIEGGHLEALRRLEEEIYLGVLDEVNPNRGTMLPGASLEYDLAHADEITSKTQQRFEEQAPALLAQLEGK